MIFKESKMNDAEAIEYLNSLNAQHLETLTTKLDNIFDAGIKSAEDVYTANALLSEYKSITGKEYTHIKEDSIV